MTPPISPADLAPGDGKSAAFDLAALEFTCLRSVLMKAEHLDWVDHIYTVLGEAANAVPSLSVSV